MLKAKSGFTLLEILIATGIFMVVMITSLAIFSGTISSSSANEQLRQTAQAARSAFESMTREARLAHGLVYVLPGGERHLVVPPFVADNGVITIYRTTKTGVVSQGTEAGQGKYKVERRVYLLDNNHLRIKIQSTRKSDGYKAKDLYVDPTILTNDSQWTDGQTTDLIPNRYTVDSLRVLRQKRYPLPTESLNTLTRQPFIQFEITVANLKVASSGKKVATTLRTMIVPRDFVSPFEVVQEGLQGVTN